VRSMTESLGQVVASEGYACGAGSYDLSLLNASEDLVSLVDRLAANPSSLDFSICLYGPPGTGKSEFARHLARRLDMDVSVKRASDLMSKWIGETEKNIQNAFREARDLRKVLIFDEVDSLLMDRRDAARHWEISEVNELLSSMERHDLPFVCTTNFMDRLDPAVMRRFTFKIRCNFLSEDQSAHAFELYFQKAPPVSLRDLQNLTPGDFAVVAKGLRYRADDVNAEEVVDLLRQECDLKPGLPGRIGF
jgi:SpoVK/Ycf46/Vps4 family AAA+-type ATPase